MSFIDKIRSRSEWQAFLVSVAVLLVNRFLDLGLTESDIYAMFSGAGAYAVSRGLAKFETPTGDVGSEESDGEDASSEESSDTDEG